ncbi:hypothetical protein F5Y16DRAFT_260298 [Xylariaceae sp. FL0255]|nr:hypothetical protein F5Y16DRAFT_260298 [Xylariaceae sp. FL0255]
MGAKYGSRGLAFQHCTAVPVNGPPGFNWKGQVAGLEPRCLSYYFSFPFTFRTLFIYSFFPFFPTTVIGSYARLKSVLLSRTSDALSIRATMSVKSYRKMRLRQKKRKARRTAYQQNMSPLFPRLPQEIRDMIYAYIFSDKRLSYGRIQIGIPDDIWGRRIVADLTALSMLRTCRRANIEIGKRWIGQVLFHSDDITTMTDKFNALPPTQLSRNRHA